MENQETTQTTSGAPVHGGHRNVDPMLLQLLVCPLTKSALRHDESAQELISDSAGLAYPVRDGIPIMLVDEARSIDPDMAHPTKR